MNATSGAITSFRIPFGGPRVAILALTMLAAGCSHAHVTQAPASAAPLAEGETLAPPVVVVVQDFATDPQAVQLDSGVRSRLEALISGGQPDTRRVEIATQVRSVVTETLVARIRKMGLSAVANTSGPPGLAPARGPIVTVSGQVEDVDQGNRTRRTLIGFGAGQSKVGVDVQIYYATPGAPTGLLTSFEADSDSGNMPGAVVTMGAGAAAGHVATSALASGGLHALSEHRTEAEREAESLANGVADSLRKVFVARGWVAAS